jgi:hypothetical protein
MITYIVGNPGSGKTYYAVFKIYQLFIFKPKDTFLSKVIKPEKQKEYSYCYTNINGFKFELDDKFIKFDYEKFYSDLEVLYLLYMDKVGDDVLNEKAKELNLHNVLIILDEAHNFLKAKEDNILVWWLTYHRHLYQDIMLITQDLSLISNEYKRIAEHFVKAVDSSKRLFKNKFRYMLYGSYKMYQKDVMQKFHVPYLKEVFNLYHSGQNASQKSFVRKFLYVSLFLFITLSIYFYFFVQSFNSDEVSAPTDTQPQVDSLQEAKATENKALSNFSNPNPNEPPVGYIYQIYCFYDRCSIQNGSYDHFDQRYLNFIFLRSPPKFNVRSFKGKGIIYFFVGFDKPVFNNLKKEELDEKSSFSSAIYSK